MLEADQVLVGRNNTRRAYNTRLRERRGITDPLPVAGDKLVCLRNNRKKGLFNGGLWRVKERGAAQARHPDHAARAGRGARARKAIKVSVRPECFTGGIEDSTGTSASPTTNSTSAMC